ncbi:MAG: hypothetical protein P8X55_00480, partial [Desulfosarcinaceae bacterium]
MSQNIPRYLFDRRDYKLLSIVNEVLSSPRARHFDHGELYAQFHPQGIKELAESRGLRIAYATIMLLQSLVTGRVEDRLGALRALRDEVIDTAYGPLRRNTARVLLQIMKELVRAHGDQWRQLQLAHDFRSTASGKPRLVRRQLHQYHLLEMPEEWNQIAFDDHVHGKYVGLIWVPRGFHDAQDFLCFLEEPEVEALMQEGRVASRYQEKRVLALLGEVNKRHRHAIREKYKLDLPELEESDFRAYVAPGQASALHLARYLHAKIVPLLSDRVEALRQDYQSTRDADEQRRIQALVDELNHLTADAMMDEYLDRVHNPDIADPEDSDPEDSNPEDANKDEEIPWLLRLDPKNLIDHLVNLRSGYRLTLNLTGLQVEDVLEILYAGEGRITRLEIFNLKDHSAGLTGHVPAIAEMQQAVNQGNVIALKSILRRSIQRLSLEDPPDASRIEQLRVILHDIITLKAFYTGTRLTSRIGSDSTGGSPRTYGMGLVVEETLPQRARRQIDRPNEARLRLPIAVQVARQIVFHPRPTPPGPSRLMNALRRLPGCGNLGLRREKSWQVHEYAT